MNNPYSQDPGDQQYATYGTEPQKNTLGLVGFIFSVTCLLAPLGLLLSLIALFKRPRGFAIAGTVVGLVFSIPHGFIAYSFVDYATMSPGRIVAATHTAEMAGLSIAIEKHRDAHNSLPTSLAELPVDASLRTDYWGTEYRLTPDSGSQTGWRLSSAGPDRVFDTADDITDLVGFAGDKGAQRAFTEEFNRTVPADQFDREAAKQELMDATMSSFGILFGDMSAPRRAPDAAPVDPASPDPDQPPADPAPADPDAP